MTSKETKKNPAESGKQEIIDRYFLMLHNDDVHSFDYVIDALIEVCNHTCEQAAQCAFITHHKGICDIRKGEYVVLKKMKDTLIDKELNVTIELLP